MEWIKDWVIQLAGITLLAAVCDMVMPHGNMEKYVRMVLGLVLIIAIVKPLTGISAEKLGTIGGEGNTRAFETRIDMTEREEVLRIYKNKLVEKIAFELKKIGAEVEDISLETEEDDEKNFGRILGVKIVLTETAQSLNTDVIKRTVGDKFGVSYDKIVISDAF